MRVEANGKSISSHWHRRKLALVLPRPKRVDQFGCGVKYITMSAQRVDVQNLIYIDSAVAALRCARVKKKRDWLWDFGHNIRFTLVHKSHFLANLTVNVQATCFCKH